MPRQRGADCPLGTPVQGRAALTPTLPKGVPPCGIRPRGSIPLEPRRPGTCRPWHPRPTVRRLESRQRAGLAGLAMTRLFRPKDLDERRWLPFRPHPGISTFKTGFCGPQIGLEAAAPQPPISSAVCRCYRPFTCVAPDPDNLAGVPPTIGYGIWGNGDTFRLVRAQTGVCIFDTTSSGKTNNPAKHLAYGQPTQNEQIMTRQSDSLRIRTPSRLQANYASRNRNSTWRNFLSLGPICHCHIYHFEQFFFRPAMLGL